MFEEYKVNKPQLCKCRINDVLGESFDTLQDLEDFIQFCSTFHLSLKYTFEISESSPPLPVLQLSISDDRISTTIHYKPTDTHSYLHHSSMVKNI